MADEIARRNVDMEVGYMLDVAGQEWVQLTLVDPSGQRFALAYSRDETQQLIELLQAQLDRMDADVD